MLCFALWFRGDVLHPCLFHGTIFVSAEAAAARRRIRILTLLVWGIDFSPQKSVFQVILWAIQVRVQAPILHPDGEKQTDDVY